MLHTLLVLSFSLATATAFAAQCKGKTQAGTQCKRAALEGRAFCQQHLEQEKPVQCKALTEEGKQCSRTAFPKHFFCQQHEAGKRLADAKQEIGQCRAFTDNGKRCSRNAAPGWKYCDQHRK